MNKDVLLVERRGKNGEIVILRTNRPEFQNRSNWEFKERSAEVYEALLEDKNAAVIVVTGVGDYFATGGQLNASDPEEKRRYQEAQKRVKAAMAKIQIPTIAAINGDCFAGGMSILIDADIAVSVDTAKFGYPEINRGGFPMMAMIAAMDVIPKKLLLEAFYSGELFSAARAKEMGLLNAVVSKDDFWPTVERYIDMIVSKPKELLAIGRRSYNEMSRMPVADRPAYGRKALSEILDVQGRLQPENEK